MNVGVGLLQNYNFIWFACRLLLAAIHTNFNADIDKHEQPLTVIYPKYKRGDATVRKLSAKRSYGKSFVSFTKLVLSVILVMLSYSCKTFI